MTDVTGDNALLGADGKVYFIDPIINFKKPVREILGDAAQPEAPAQGQREEIGATPAAEPTALERVPRDEKGKPRFERAESPEAAWDALVEHHKGDAAKARVTAGIMVENTRKAFEKARKLKPKGNDPDEILALQEAIEAQLAEAEHAHEFWQKMAGVEDARAAARQEAEKAADAESEQEAGRSTVGKVIYSGDKKGRKYSVVVTKDETRDGVRKVTLDARRDSNGQHIGVYVEALSLPISFMEAEDRVFDIAYYSGNETQVCGVIVDADGRVSAQLKDGRTVYVNDLPQDMAQMLGIKVTGKHREEQLTEAEVDDYEDNVRYQMKKKDRHTLKAIKSDIWNHENVYLAAGYSPEEARAKAEKFAEDLIETLTPLKIGGFTIFIENERGSFRDGFEHKSDNDEEEPQYWKTEMRNDYGFISGPDVGPHGEGVDPIFVFMSNDMNS